MWKITSSNNLITFNSLKSGLVMSKKLEKVMILMAFFCITKGGCEEVWEGLPQATIC